MVSIIVPVYNVESYLDLCLESISKQSYQDWECILIDDGSKDNSPAICDDWAKKDTRFLVIHKNNEGVSVARNTGLLHAQGEFVCFVDSDDWVGADYIQDMIEAQNLSGADYIVTGFTSISFPKMQEDIVKPKMDRYIIPDSSCCSVFLENIGLVYGPTGKLYKSNIVLENSIRFPQDMSLGEDMIFNFSYILHCSSIFYKSVSHYNYRQSQTGLCNKYRNDFYEVLTRQWLFRKQSLQKKGIWNSDIERYFSKQLWGYTYDCLFSFGRQPYKKIHNILVQLDTRILFDYKNDFACSNWIKFCILHQLAFPIFIITHVK